MTVAIIGILAAIALPSYRDYVLRGQLVEAHNALSMVRADMERYFQDNRQYTKFSTFDSACDAPPAAGSFTISCPTATRTATAYIAQAVGSGPTSGFTFTVDQQNNRATTVTGVSGWNSCTNDWVTKKGPAC